MVDAVKSADTKSVGGVLRNPLVVFGLILLAGDGPLVTAYALTSDVFRANVLMWATILFIFSMGSFFCYLVAFKPRHLYAPGEIPQGAIDRSLYHEPTEGKNLLKEAQDLVENLSESSDEDQRRSIAQNINARLQVAKEVQTAYELLLIPGYDISVILEILDHVNSDGRVDAYAVAGRRGITPATIDIIVDTMSQRRILGSKRGKLFLAENGIRLMNALREYLNAAATEKHGPDGLSG